MSKAISFSAWHKLQGNRRAPCEKAKPCVIFPFAVLHILQFAQISLLFCHNINISNVVSEKWKFSKFRENERRH